MSNTQVGNIYSQIISDVIDSSRVDFEEGGVDDHVLEELRLVRFLIISSSFFVKPFLFILFLRLRLIVPYQR